MKTETNVRKKKRKRMKWKKKARMLTKKSLAT